MISFESAGSALSIPNTVLQAVVSALGETSSAPN
jgi:hypothetical protein